MRDERDIKTVKIEIMAMVEIDLERIESDPLWPTLARGRNLEDTSQLKSAIEQYICRYLGQENLLENAPFTNGPAATMGTNAEVRL
jgi:hypothetical protein